MQEEAFFCDGWQYLSNLNQRYPDDPEIKGWWEFIIRKPIEFRQPTSVWLSNVRLSKAEEEELT